MPRRPRPASVHGFRDPRKPLVELKGRTVAKLLHGLRDFEIFVADQAIIELISLRWEHECGVRARSLERVNHLFISYLVQKSLILDGIYLGCGPTEFGFGKQPRAEQKQWKSISR